MYNVNVVFKSHLIPDTAITIVIPIIIMRMVSEYPVIIVFPKSTKSYYNSYSPLKFTDKGVRLSL